MKPTLVWRRVSLLPAVSPEPFEEVAELDCFRSELIESKVPVADQYESEMNEDTSEIGT